MVPLNLVLRKETGFKLRQNKTMSPAFSCRAHSCINRKPPARLMVVKRPITKIRAAISLRQADNVDFRPRKLARNAPSPHLSFQVKDHVQRDAGISGDPLGRIPVFQEGSRNLFNCIPTFKCHINHIHSLRHEVSRTKITQFHLILQYLEYRVARKIAEIGLTVERINVTAGFVLHENSCGGSFLQKLPSFSLPFYIPVKCECFGLANRRCANNAEHRFTNLLNDRLMNPLAGREVGCSTLTIMGAARDEYIKCLAEKQALVLCAGNSRAGKSLYSNHEEFLLGPFRMRGACCLR